MRSVELMLGDCLELLPSVASGSVDMVLCDLPYGTTQNKWDTIIPLDRLWAEYWRIVKPNGAVVLTAAQPFTSVLVMSQPKKFKYEWVWQKSHATGHLNANRAPMREHESVLVFALGAAPYFPQKTQKEPHLVRPDNKGFQTATSSYGANDPNAPRTERVDVGFPKSIIKFKNAKAEGCSGQHPTQKPVALMEYLIRTYTNPGDTVLDNTMGSGTTGVAAIQTGRRFIGMEMDPGYFTIAADRIAAAQKLPAVAPQQPAAANDNTIPNLFSLEATNV